MALHLSAKDFYTINLHHKKHEHQFGFDAKAKFQLVPRGEQRALLIRGGKGTDCKVDPATNPSGCEVIQADIDADREIWVAGKTIGDFTVTALNSFGTPLDRIRVKVVNPRIVKVAFYGTADNHPHSATIALSKIAPLVSKANDIVDEQTGIRMKWGQTFSSASFGEDLGNSIDIDQLGSVKFTGGTWADTDAEWHVFFVWQIKGRKDPSSPIPSKQQSPGANGVTLNNVTLIEWNLDPEQMAVTLAHEFIHFCSISGSGHDSLQDDLMYNGSPHGIMIREIRQRKLIRP